MPTLHNDIALTSAHTIASGWNDITGMDTVGADPTIDGTGSVVLMIANITILDGADMTAAFRFAVDGVGVGPEVSAFSDATNLTNSVTLMWAVDSLSAASHNFAVQALLMSGSPSVDTGYTRTFQVIEFLSGEANILVDQTASDAQVTPAAWANIPSMSATVTPAANACHLFYFGATPIGSADRSAEFQFAVGGTRDGPVGSDWADANGDFGGVGMAWFTDGLANSSQVLSVQWQIRQGTPSSNDFRTRGFQVLEIADDFTMLTDLSLTSAATATSSFATMTGMTSTPTIDSTDSIVLVSVVQVIANNADRAINTQLLVGGVREGPELSNNIDEADGGASGAMLHAITGESGATAIVYQWVERIALSTTIDATRPRSFQVLDLKAPTAPSVGGKARIIFLTGEFA